TSNPDFRTPCGPRRHYFPGVFRHQDPKGMRLLTSAWSMVSINVRLAQMPNGQRTGASRFAQRQIERQGRLAPVADLYVMPPMSEPPIQNIGSVDVTGKRIDGGVDLFIVASSR